MNKIVSLAALTLVLATAACGVEGSAPVTTGDASVAPSPKSAVDDAIAEAETGRDPAASRALLEKALADTATSQVDRGRASLALARVLEKRDSERAANLAEDAVAAGIDDAEEYLFRLLTGAKFPSSASRRGTSVIVPNAARELSKYFPAATADNAVDVDIHMFGGLGEGGPQTGGAFDVAGALRERAAEACPLCDEVKTSIHTTVSARDLWAAIPRSRDRLDRALVVVYVDEQALPPARYERWLAAPLADIKSAFAAGEGLVAVKERPGAPPLVTIAAPRVSLMPLVEAKFADMKSLPLTPSRVAIDTHLSRDEIRYGVRARLGAYGACYEELRARKPNAAGTLELTFAVKSDGSLKDVANSVNAGLDDATFRSCIDGAVAKVRLPAWSRDPSATTTVKYPIRLSP